MSETPVSATDAELVRLLAQTATGDVASFARVYDATSAAAFGLAVRVTGDRDLAEDVLQKAFASVWTDARRYSARRTPPRTWILAIAHRHAVERLRATRAEAPGASAVHEPNRTAASHRQLRKLPDDQERAVSLAYLGGYTQPEIAAMTEAPLSTVKSMTRSALDQLRDAARPVTAAITLPLTGSFPIQPPPTGAVA